MAAIAAAPPLMAAIGLGSIAGQVAQGLQGSKVAQAQANADNQAAQRQAEYQRQRALEVEAAGQRETGNRLREMKRAQSSLTANAAASGGGATDETVLDLMGDIEQEGQYNARNATTAAAQRATGIRYQANIDSWRADATARMKKFGAKQQAIGGIISAVGKGAQQMTGFAGRYGGSRGVGSYRYGGGTGYGTGWTPRVTRYG